MGKCYICENKPVVINRICGRCAIEHFGYSIGKSVDQCHICGVMLLKKNLRNHVNRKHNIKRNFTNNE